MRNDWLKKVMGRNIRGRNSKRRLRKLDVRYVRYVCPDCKSEDTVEDDPFITDRRVDSIAIVWLVLRKDEQFPLMDDSEFVSWIAGNIHRITDEIDPTESSIRIDR